MQIIEEVYNDGMKSIYTTDVENKMVMKFSDNIKSNISDESGCIPGKAIINNRISNHILSMLEKKGIPTHLIAEFDEQSSVIKTSRALDFIVIVRNYVSGEFSKKIGIDEGKKLKSATFELYLSSKCEVMINGYHAIALNYISREGLNRLVSYATKINDVLVECFADMNMELIDYELNFGYIGDEISLIGEISPDTCTLWDSQTHEKLGRDRFIYHLGHLEEAYKEIYKRFKLDSIQH